MQQGLFDSESSSKLPVVCGVPHGSALGPLVFLALIIDLPAALSSQTCLFANDCILYIDQSGTFLTETLQIYFNEVAQREQQWAM